MGGQDRRFFFTECFAVPPRANLHICSLHTVHGLTPSTMCIFIHLDPSGSSRWLGNACLSLPLSKLHCIMAPGKCNGHYECHNSSLLLLHPAPLLLKAGPCYKSLLPSLAPTQELQQLPVSSHCPPHWKNHLLCPTRP